MTLHARDVESSFELFLYRLSGAAVLDAAIYESIEADPHATRQAVAVVLLSAVAAGIGASGLVGPRPVVLAAISALALVTWLAWGMLMFQIGTVCCPSRRPARRWASCCGPRALRPRRACSRSSPSCRAWRSRCSLAPGSG